MADKLLCSECLQELDSFYYNGLGNYVTPCDCRFDRERQVAIAATEYTRAEIFTGLVDHVEGIHENVELENGDDPEHLKTLDNFLRQVYKEELELDINDDPYDELDI